MRRQFLRVVGNAFELNGEKLLLKSVGLGNWLNLEHFMLGIPGTQSQIRGLLEERYGKEASRRFWDRFYNLSFSQIDVAEIAGRGLNSIRVPVNHRLFSDGSSFETSTAIQQINRVLPLCKEAGLLVIIDMHTAPLGQNPDWHSDNTTGDCGFWKSDDARAELVTLWKRIAGYYKDEDSIGGYDLLNEPCYLDPALDDALVGYYADAINGIRAVDTKHVILIEGNTYSRDFSMFQENLDDNLSYSFHFYPFLQTGGLDIPKSDAKSRLYEMLKRDVSYSHLTQTLQKPLWCGETGHPHHRPEKSYIVDAFLELLEEEGVSWALWPYKDVGEMGMVTLPEDCDWNRRMRELSGGWRFFDFFTQDSFVALENERDHMDYYRRMAAFSNSGFEVFAKNLNDVSIDEFEELLESWALAP